MKIWKLGETNILLFVSPFLSLHVLNISKNISNKINFNFAWNAKKFLFYARRFSVFPFLPLFASNFFFPTRTMSESWYNNKTKLETAEIIQLVFLRIPDSPFASLNTNASDRFAKFNYLNFSLHFCQSNSRNLPFKSGLVCVLFVIWSLQALLALTCTFLPKQSLKFTLQLLDTFFSLIWSIDISPMRLKPRLHVRN